jgi:hypothetical protein
MRLPVRARIVLASISIAAASILSLAASVLADSGPGPFPK